MIEVFIWAVATGTVLKMLFKMISWVFQELDGVYRDHLDRIIDRLDQRSVFSIGKSIISRMVGRINPYLSRPLLFYSMVGFTSLILNSVTYAIALVLAVSTHFPSFSSGFSAVLLTVARAGLVNFVLMNTLVGILGAVFDIVSLAATLWLLNRVRFVRTGASLIGHLCVDAIVGFISLMWAYLVLDLTLHMFYDQMLPFVTVFSIGAPGDFIQKTAADTLVVNPVLWWLIVAVGITAALPSVVYLAVLLPVVVLRIVPTHIQKALSLILFRLTTDRKPVFDTIGNFIGCVGTVIAGMIRLLILS